MKEEKPNGAILKLIKMTYQGEELEMQLLAWEKYPTLKSDCPTTQRFKELARNDFAKKLMKQRESLANFVKELKAQKV